MATHFAGALALAENGVGHDSSRTPVQASAATGMPRHLAIMAGFSGPPLRRWHPWSSACAPPLFVLNPLECEMTAEAAVDGKQRQEAKAVEADAALPMYH